MLGVCSQKVKDSLDSVPFNDQSLISINSCGYVVNRGKMSVFPGRVRIDDVVKMIVSISSEEVRWFCNDIELARAELGSLKKETMYPLIGLGNFCD